MKKVVKLNANQLRALIREALEPSDTYVDPSALVSGFIVQAVVDQLEHESDLIASNSFVMMSGTVDPEEWPVPARIEDHDGYAASAADKVVEELVKSPHFKEAIKAICVDLIRNLDQD